MVPAAMPREKPWLSVLLPTRDGARFLREALESVCAQQQDGLEVIAVDDGSTDATPALLAEYAERLPLRVERAPVHGSWPASVNFALGQARGEISTILHQDDLWEPGRSLVVRKLFDGAPGAALALHPSHYIDDRSRRLGAWTCPLPEARAPLPFDFVRQRLVVQNFVAVPGASFRTSAALACGGLAPSLWYTADWDLWLRLARGGTVHTRERLASFRLHTGSQTIQRSGEGLRAQLERVLDREVAEGPLPARVERAARFSIEVNLALASSLHGDRRGLRALLPRLFQLGPAAAALYLRDSRIHERLSARARLFAESASRRARSRLEVTP